MLELASKMEKALNDSKLCLHYCIVLSVSVMQASVTCTSFANYTA